MSRLLEIDMVSMAGATGHAACHRLASVMMDLDPHLWANGGVPCGDRDMEQDVQTLAAYVCERRVVSGEVLFIKAAELGVHQLGAGAFYSLEAWQRTAYGLFAAATLTCHAILAQAQADAREREARLRVAALAEKPKDPPQDVPAATPASGQQATPDTSPDQGVADTAAEGEGALEPSAADVQPPEYVEKYLDAAAAPKRGKQKGA